MFAMIVGATFYGYMIGVITSQVAEGDAHAKAYYEKMKKISAYSGLKIRSTSNSLLHT